MTDSRSSETIERATIMVVDDTPDSLSLLSGVLKEFYKVKVANSGEKALKHLQGNDKPDLILLDIMMPGMSGYDVLRELKGNPETSGIPVIFLTAINLAGDEDSGMGAADYIIKPVLPSELLAQVKAHLENSRSWYASPDHSSPP